MGRTYAERITTLAVGLVPPTTDACFSILTPHSKRGPGSWVRSGPLTMNRVSWVASLPAGRRLKGLPPPCG